MLAPFGFAGAFVGSPEEDYSAHAGGELAVGVRGCVDEGLDYYLAKLCIVWGQELYICNDQAAEAVGDEDYGAVRLYSTRELRKFTTNKAIKIVVYDLQHQKQIGC